VSILDNPPHVATVYPVVPVDDGYGGTQPGEGDPITVRCIIQPRAADESAVQDAGGYRVDDTYRLAARSLPAGAWARVTWDGDDYTVVGEPRRHGVSRRTRHDVATIRRR